jgi:hypothetical protein
MHEALSRDEKVIGSSNRSFGLVFAAVFLIIGCWPLIWGQSARWWALAVAVVFGAAALFAPGILEWPNRLWLRFGLLLHRIVSPVALAVIFYLAIMPTGLLLRVFGKDLLRLRREPQAPSYWIDREPPGPPPDSLKNQF